MRADYADFDFIIQPGWNNSSPEHWQSHWQQRLGAHRVDNQEWNLPRLEDWRAGLDRAVDACRRPAVVIAHSLGCITVAHYAQRHPHKLAGALLVAPADVERARAPAALLPFAPLPQQPLPFAARIVASGTDPFCRPLRSARIASLWQAPLAWLLDAGHISVASGHRQWPDGLAELNALLDGLRARESGGVRIRNA
ncbi:MAG: alpha/beta hydrolase [Pseudogulbenkiania sp.]|nr:alpha/beta hydrolase [Pseudogulbenkiania sp.]